MREGEYAWRSDLKLRFYRETAAAIAAAVERAEAGGHKLNAEQLAARDSARSVPRLESLAAAAGVPAGDSPAEVAADRANVLLFQGYRLFAGSDFNTALRAAKLMPGAGSTMADYRQTYTRAELETLRAWLGKLAASGKNLSDAPADLTTAEKNYLVGALDRLDDILVKSFGAPAAPAPKTLLERVRRPGEDALALTRLSLAIEARPADAAFALEAQRVLFELLALRVPAADAEAVLEHVQAATANSAEEAAALVALKDALNGPQGALLKAAALKQADAAVQSIAEQNEAAFTDFNQDVLKTGLRDSESSFRSSFKLRHYRALEAAIEARASATKLTREQRVVVARARALLPALIALGASAGVPAGDSPAEAAAEILNPVLQNGYAVFAGSVFNDQLRAKGFMDQGSSNGLDDHKQAYTQKETAALRDWLKSVLDSGKGWDAAGSAKPLTDEEKKTLSDAIAAADRALAGFNGKNLHAFAPLALAALPAFSVAPWLLFGVLALAAAYLAWKFLPSLMAADDGGLAKRESIPGSIIARHRRIELSARRMATAVNGGSFRSRFIGPGGTDFAEARPYQGEDMREMDWKTSAKKDELYAKKFELERDMPLMLVIDISGSGSFSTTGTDKRTAIEDAAAVLALAAAHSNVRVGAVFISDRVEQVFPARGGSRHAMMIVDAILKAQPTGTATDLKPGLEAAGKLLGSRAMVAILSDFIAPDFKDALGSLASRHDVRAIRVTDPGEMGPLPDVGLLPVVDAETGATRMLDTSSKAGRAEAAASVSRREAAVENAFTSSRINPISLSTEGDPLEALERAFHPKTKQPFKP